MQSSLLLLKFVTGHYGFIVLFGFISYIIGLRLTRHVNYDSVWEEISICVSLGLGLIGSLIFALGIFGLLYRWVVVLAIVAGVAASYPVPIQVAQRISSAIRHATFRARALLAAAFLALSVPILVLPLYPPTQFDATFFFLASAKIYVQRHGVVFLPYSRPPVIAQLNEMLFTLGLLFYDDIAAQLFQLLMLTMLALALVAFCRRNFSKQAGWWAAALLLANPKMLWCGTVAYLDISLTLFGTLSGYAFWNWFHSRQRHWLILSGAFCGFAASTKQSGLFYPLLFGIMTLYFAIKERKFAIPLLLGVTGFAAGGGWYIRNYYYTRNPFFPFFGQVFGYTWFSPADVEGLLGDLRLYGVGRSPLALIMMPWSLTFKPDVFFSEGLYYSKLYFFALPIVAFFVIKDVRIRKVVGFLLAFMVFWAFSSQILRYLLPAIPVLSVATAASFDMLLGWVPFSRKWRSQGIVVAIIFVAVASGGWLYSLDYWQTNGPIPVTSPQRDAYLGQHLASYPIYKMLNEFKGRRYRIYSVQDENMAYFVDGLYMGDYFGPARYSRIMDKLTDGEALYNELKSLRIDYFLVNNQRREISLPQDSFFQEHFKLTYPRGKILLFDLTGEPLQDMVGPQLLENPSFESMSAGWPVGWGHAGNPLADASGQKSYDGLAAVHCSGAENVFFQSVPVKQGENYLLRFRARADQNDQPARIQVNWADAQGKFLSPDLQVITVGTSWYPYGNVVIAPPQAASAVVYASCHEKGNVWMDDFSFAAFHQLSKSQKPQ